VLDDDDPYEVGLTPAPPLRVEKLERSRAENGHSVEEIEGELALDQDVGAGYVYPALLTEATRVAR
jgi:hypothetical protein